MRVGSSPLELMTVILIEAPFVRLEDRWAPQGHGRGQIARIRRIGTRHSHTSERAKCTTTITGALCISGSSLSAGHWVWVVVVERRECHSLLLYICRFCTNESNSSICPVANFPKAGDRRFVEDMIFYCHESGRES